jgi:hypothetical protein
MNSTGSRSPATPLQFVERCAGAHMRPPLTPRVHLGGGLIPTRICHAFKAGAPLRVRVAATATPSEPSKDEDKPIGLVKKVLDSVFSGVVWMVFASFLILICRFGITHSHAVSYIATIYIGCLNSFHRNMCIRAGVQIFE